MKKLFTLIMLFSVSVVAAEKQKDGISVSDLITNTCDKIGTTLSENGHYFAALSLSLSGGCYREGIQSNNRKNSLPQVGYDMCLEIKRQFNEDYGSVCFLEIERALEIPNVLNCEKDDFLCHKKLVENLIP